MALERSNVKKRMVNSTLHVSSLLPHKQKKNAVVVTVKAGSANLKCLKANSAKSCSGARRKPFFHYFYYYYYRLRLLLQSIIGWMGRWVGEWMDRIFTSPESRFENRLHKSIYLYIFCSFHIILVIWVVDRIPLNIDIARSVYQYIYRIISAI